jgi:hypothetical protein
MTEEYSLDYMIKVFTDHVEKIEKDRKDHPEHYLPEEGDKFPEFNLCKDILSFAKEINRLKHPYTLRIKNGVIHE